MGMTGRHQVLGILVGLMFSLFAGGMFVWSGVRSGDRGDVLIGVAIPFVFLLLAGPVTRWLRRGDGPHPTRGGEDDDRERYVRLRHSGGKRQRALTQRRAGECGRRTGTFTRGRLRKPPFGEGSGIRRESSGGGHSSMVTRTARARSSAVRSTSRRGSGRS